MPTFEITFAVAKTVCIAAMIVLSVPFVATIEGGRQGDGGILQTINGLKEYLMRGNPYSGCMTDVIGYVAPPLSLLAAIFTIAAIPFSDKISVFGESFFIGIIETNVGPFVLLAMLMVGMQAVFLALVASDRKSSLIDAVEGASLPFALMVALGFAIASVLVVTGSLKLSEMIMQQGMYPWHWNIVRAPVALLIFISLVSAFPHIFMAGGDSDVFAAARRVSTLVWSLVIASVFLGGWQIPFLESGVIEANSTEIILFGGPAVGALLAIVGGISVMRFKRSTGGLESYDPIFVGVGFLTCGVFVVAVSYVLGGITLPLWASGILTLALQATTFIVKAICVCLIVVWLQKSILRRDRNRMCRYAWIVVVPVAVVNLLVTAFVYALLS